MALIDLGKETQAGAVAHAWKQVLEHFAEMSNENKFNNEAK